LSDPRNTQGFVYMLAGSFRRPDAKPEHSCKCEQRIRRCGESETEMHNFGSRTAEAAAECRHIVAKRLNCAAVNALVFVICAGNSHLLHSRLECGPLHSQPSCSSTQTGNHTAGFAQHPKNVLPFQAF